MSFELTTEDFDGILQNQYGISKEQLIERLEQNMNAFDKQTAHWRQQLEEARQILLLDEKSTPIQIIKRMNLVCEYERLLDDDKMQLCEKFAKWKTSNTAVAIMLDKLNIVQRIPREGLDNQQLESILEVMQKTFGGIQMYKVQTRDFMFCDVQKRFTDSNYPNEQLMNQIESSLSSVSETGAFKDLQSGMMYGSEFGRLTGSKIANMYALGIDLLAIVVNTSNCDEGGKHWVAFVISHQSKTVEIFDSTGQYTTELTPVQQFAKYITKECSTMFSSEYKLRYFNQEVQSDLNTCGVFSLFYIYARILGAEPEDVFSQLKSPQGNNHVRMFKRILFG